MGGSLPRQLHTNQSPIILISLEQILIYSSTRTLSQDPEPTPNSPSFQDNYQSQQLQKSPSQTAISSPPTVSRVPKIDPFTRPFDQSIHFHPSHHITSHHTTQSAPVTTRLPTHSVIKPNETLDKTAEAKLLIAYPANSASRPSSSSSLSLSQEKKRNQKKNARQRHKSAKSKQDSTCNGSVQEGEIAVKKGMEAIIRVSRRSY